MSNRIVVELARPVRRRLERKRRKCGNTGLQTRIRIVLLYGKGWGAHRIAEALGCAPATAVRVVHRFLDYGEEGLEDGRCDNGCPKVDADLLQALWEMVGDNPESYSWSRPTWTRELLAKTLMEQTGVRLSVSTVGRMLARLRVRWGMPAATVTCPWSKRRKNRRIRKILKIVGNLPRGEVAYYEDEVDVHLNPRVGRDWMRPGEQKLVLTPGKNQKRHLAGALAADGSELVFVQSDHKNTDLFLTLLEKLRRHHPGARRIHLVLDNCSIHSSKRTQRYLKEHEELFVLHFLPPYTPRHNKIERFWRELHANVTRNHRCKSMKELMRKVTAFLRREARRRRRLNHLTATRRSLKRAA